MKKARNMHYPTKTITNVDNADDDTFFADTVPQAEFLLHNQKQAAWGIGLFVNVNETKFMCCNQDGDLTSLSGMPLTITLEHFIYLGSNMSFTENYVNLYISKVQYGMLWTDYQKYGHLPYLNIWKLIFSKAFLGLCCCIDASKHLEEMLYGNYTRMLWADTAGEVKMNLNNVLLWIPKKVVRQFKTFIQWLCEDPECHIKDLPGLMNDRNDWQGVMRICAISAI